MWMLNNMLLCNQRITEGIKEKIEKIETNENKSMMIQNLWDAAKAVLRRKLQQCSLTSGKKNLKQANLKPKATRERRTNKFPKLVEGKKS